VLWVQFYEQCSLALLEEWDRTKQVDRANKFESHQKVAVLSRVAFEHISSADINDELIDREVIHKYVREVMERMSLKKEEYPLMTNEIVRNSGLIHAIPPDDYRFPHRTFMEYFAAFYLEKKKSFEEIKTLAAYALFRMSKLDGFYEFLDNTETGLLAESTKKMIDIKYDEWGWRWERPRTEGGKKLTILICLYSADWLEKSKDESDLKQVDNRFRYLTTGFLTEIGTPFIDFNLIGFGYYETATTYGLKKWWQKDKNFKNFLDFFYVIGLLIAIFSYAFSSLVGTVEFIQYQFDFALFNNENVKKIQDFLYYKNK